MGLLVLGTWGWLLEQMTGSLCIRMFMKSGVSISFLGNPVFLGLMMLSKPVHQKMLNVGVPIQTAAWVTTLYI